MSCFSCRCSDKPGGARRAVALADQVLGAAPAAVARQVQADELAHRVEVALVVVELGHLLALGHARMAGADRVDEHQVAVGQQRVFVVDQRVRRRRRIAHLVGRDALRAEDAQVQPDAARPGPAVEAERERARLLVAFALQRVGDEEEVARGLSPRRLPSFSSPRVDRAAPACRRWRCTRASCRRSPAVLGDDDALLGLRRSGVAGFFSSISFIACDPQCAAVRTSTHHSGAHYKQVGERRCLFLGAPTNGGPRKW